MRASTTKATHEAARSSNGICLRPTPGMCLVHDGKIAHAGNAVTKGTRYVLVAFFHGGEGPLEPDPPPPKPPPCIANAAQSCLTSSGAGEVALPQMDFAVPRPLPRVRFPEDTVLVRGPVQGNAVSKAAAIWFGGCMSASRRPGRMPSLPRR